MAVEVDGPSHFVGRTKAPTGSTTLKRRQLRAAGWPLLAVPYWEWSALSGDGDEQRELLSRGLQVALAAAGEGGELASSRGKGASASGAAGDGGSAASAAAPAADAEAKLLGLGEEQLSAMKVADMKLLLRPLGLGVSGKKEELRRRLSERRSLARR